MARPTRPRRAKLICGMISADRAVLSEAERLLAETMGDVDRRSEIFDFDLTHYDDEQMGSPLYRQLISFADPVDPGVLVDAKLRSNAIESAITAARPGGPARAVNLDPGYVTEAKLVLASMKDFSHRIYLSRGVHAEITLMYRKGRWKSLDWTFPDFAAGRYDAFLTAVRETLRLQMRNESDE